MDEEQEKKVIEAGRAIKDACPEMTGSVNVNLHPKKKKAKIIVKEELK